MCSAGGRRRRSRRRGEVEEVAAGLKLGASYGLPCALRGGNA